jgi:hypothetical protein
LVFKRKLLASGPDFIATQEGIYDVIITKNIADIGNDCGYNPTSFKIENQALLLQILKYLILSQI